MSFPGYTVISLVAYLSGIDEAIGDQRTQLVARLMRDPHGYVDFDQVARLARLTRDEELVGWAAKQATNYLEQRETLDWSRVGSIYDISAMSCQAGRQQRGRKLAAQLRPRVYGQAAKTIEDNYDVKHVR